MGNEVDDIELIQAVLDGKKSSYAQLVSRYQNYVFTLAFRYVNNRETAEELAQDVFVKAYRFLADYKRTAKFSTWLYTIVRTTCLSHLRKKQNDTVFCEPENIARLADSSLQPNQQLEHKTQKILIEGALRQLPDDDALVINLFYLAEQSLEEIGVIMGLPQATVKVRLFRARQKLKEVMEQRYSRELALQNY